jgi:hypothetical protein
MRSFEEIAEGDVLVNSDTGNRWIVLSSRLVKRRTKDPDGYPFTWACLVDRITDLPAGIEPEQVHYFLRDRKRRRP